MVGWWHLKQIEGRRVAHLAQKFLASERLKLGIQGSDFEGPQWLSMRGYVRLILAECSWLSAELDQAWSLTQSAREDFQNADCLAGVSDAHWMEANVATDRGDVALRRSSIESALTVARQVSGINPSQRQRIQSCELRLATFDVFERGVEVFETHRESVGAFLTSEDAGCRTLAHGFFAHCEVASGHHSQSIEHMMASEAAALACGQARRALVEACNVSTTLLDLDDQPACLDHIQTAVVYARKCEWPGLLSSVLSVFGNALLKINRTESAAALAEEAMAALEKMPMSDQFLHATHLSGEAHLATGKLDVARERFQSIVNLRHSSRSRKTGLHGLIGLSRVALAAHDRKEAEALARRALEESRAENDRVVESQAWQLLGNAIDDPWLSVDALEHALRLADEHLGGDKRPSLLHELSGHLEAAGRLPEALTASRQAYAGLASQQTQDAVRRGMSLEVRYKTERALRDAEIQRQTAQAETQRAAELEAFNTQLREAMAALEATQTLLLQRNEELNTAHAQITELSLTDPLTKLKNRRFLTQVIDSAVAECLRGHTGPDGAQDTASDILFFLIDIDHFKAVNDEHGHAAGDAVLVQLKDRLRVASREQDYLVRWGGEEFLVAVRGADRRDAPVIAERLRRSVASKPFELPSGLALTKTCSIGHCAFPIDPVNPLSATWEQAVDVADKRLYEAKRSGRNRCVGSDETDATTVNA